MRPEDAMLYRRWIVANGWAESLGLGTTFVVGRGLAPLLDRSAGTAVILGGALTAVVLGTLLEGVLVGVAQERVVRRRFTGIGQGRWVLATAIGAGLAWLLGMMPSTVIGLLASDGMQASAPEPGPLLTLALAAALGIVAGPVLGVAQWMVLRRHVARATRWLWANTLAWAVGMPLVFAGMDLMPWSRSWIAVTALIYALFAGVGVVVGAIHGRILVGLR